MVEQFMEQIVRNVKKADNVSQKGGKIKRKMRKWVLFLQLEPGQEAYCLFGDKDKEIVVKCECKSVYILEDKQPRYNMKAIKCVHSKDKSISKGSSLDFLFACKNCNINTGDGIGAWPVFTSQEAYKEWRGKKNETKVWN